MSADEELSAFHPLVREWFLGRYGRPTPVQAAAWPRIASGEHVLALAPTGSGKTLAAFLDALSRLASGELPADRCSVLYVSPLKALGEDVRRNLEAPLAELAALFRERGESFPPIRAATRSGDTSQAERRRMLARPPAILVTTPESLAIILDSRLQRAMLGSVRLVILDEVHAVAGSKRGALLACQVGRLALLAGEFQRLALSATVRPPEAVAAFVGGRRLSRGPGGEAVYEERRVAVVAPPSEKRIELGVEWPQAPLPAEGEPDAASARYAAIVPAICSRIDATSGVLVFSEARRRAERLAFLINEAKGEGTAWAHHGSLSKEVRQAVEARFKAGELDCVVATASLELGIDVGSVEEVLLAGSPNSVSSALQRVGRSGHGVGEASRGRLYPFNGMDLVLAAAVAKGCAERAVEELRPPSCPLDVLAQALLELTLEPELTPAPGEESSGEGRWTVDALYDTVRSFPPFRLLTRDLFDSVLELLAGRYAGSRLRELEPRLSLDRATGRVEAKDAARALLNFSGGAIPDRGLYSLRLAGSRAKLGELDEEFVWERKVGEAFSLGTQTWRIVEIGSEAVFVEPTGPDPDIVPFWKGEARFRSPEISRRALELLDRLDPLDADRGSELLRRDYGFDEGAARACARFVAAQKASGLGLPALPGTRRVVLERHEDPSRSADCARLVLHTLRGLAINEPVRLALEAAWEEETGLPIRSIADDDSILLVVPALAEGDPSELAARLLGGLGEGGRLEGLVRRVLEGSGLFGAQFRENAGRFLLLPRGLPGKRMPLWVTRLRAKRLFAALRGREDFPAIVETWRSCLADLFDLEGAAELARGLASGEIELASIRSRLPSPLGRETLWAETGAYMYEGDALGGRASSSVSDRVIAEALGSARARPALGRDLVLDYERRLKRLLPGWAPGDGAELAEWAKERVLIPASELPAILEAAGPSLAASLEADPSCGRRLLRLTLPGASEELLVHPERRAALLADPASLVAEWLRREALVTLDRLTSIFGLPAGGARELAEGLEDEGLAVLGRLVEGDEAEYLADSQNLEVLLRRKRRAARPPVVARPRSELFGLVARVQGLRGEGSSPGDWRAAFAALEGYPLAASLWESDILPARLGPEAAARAADEALASGEWLWFGSGREELSFAKLPDLELFSAGGAASRLLPGGESGFDFWAIRSSSGLSSREAALALWAEAWKGLVSADSFAPLREGLVNRFGRDLPELGRAAGEEEGRDGAAPFGARRRLPRALRERWRAGAPVSGSWFRLELEEAEARDPLDEEELDAARVRILVGRYGLLCRALLERELPALRWGRLFPALRRLELSGELLAGRFFEGIEGPQFLGAGLLRGFQELGTSREAPLWLSSCDPAASALDPAAGSPLAFPQRVPANRICVLDGALAAVSSRSYQELGLSLDPEDPRLPELLGFYKKARERPISPERRIAIEAVNGEAASRSPYAQALRAAGFEADRGRMILW
ncbi:MAG TPA: DEAD/DEAH box helicase [Spirochaetia bacterium]|nr:DEAD/DEAH box helicase [Spirochaetia bacterium]